MRRPSLFWPARPCTPRPAARPLRLEPLEGRDAPAVLVSPTRLAYRDMDGDRVTVTFSRPVLDANTVNLVFGFSPGGVDGQAATKQQLRTIDLTALPPAAATGVSIAVVATRDPAAGGDGFAAVGQIDATNRDLGAVSVDGDLGRLRAGDGNLDTTAVRALAAQSLGRYGTSTGAPDLRTQVQGRLGSLRVRGDVRGAQVHVAGGGAGDLGSAVIGGSLLGGAADLSGSLVADGSVGSITIRGTMTGGSGTGTGYVQTFGDLGALTVGGSVVAGTGDYTGTIRCLAVGAITIGGDLVGGSAAGVGPLTNTGCVLATRVGRLTIGGSLVAGTDQTQGMFLNNGAIRVRADLGAVLIKGSVVGNPTNPAVISACGSVAPAAAGGTAIGSVRVLGRVEYAQILAGVLQEGQASNADARIGSVVVGGDWVASSLVAGAVSGNGYYGDQGDAPMSGPIVHDDPTISSGIGSLSVGGQLFGTVGGADFFGIVAQVVGGVRVGGTAVPVTPGPGNDEFYLGVTGDFAVNEV